MAASREAAAPEADREIVLSREYDAPRELVFDAWTDPEHVGRWWGPNGFTTTTQEMDVRPEGNWRFILHGPDGTDYKNRIVYIEVERPTRLVYEHSGEEEGADVRFRTTVTFAAEGGKTRLTMRAVFPSAAARDHAVEKYGALEGAKQHLARLGEYLALSGTEADREIVSSRDFAAPRDMVFQAFANPDRLARWWGPSGFTNTIQQFDLRPGGAWRIVMHGPDGTDYPNESEFIEVVRPERVVFVHKEPVHRFRMTITFAEKSGGTRLTWRMLFDSAEELARVRAFIDPANEQNFDRLAAHLAGA